MGSMIKYPQKIIYDRKTKDNEYVEQSWDKNTLEFIKKENGNGTKTNLIESKDTNLSKPGKLKLTNFNFGIHENAKINTIKVGWVDKVEGLKNNGRNPPIIPGVSMKLLNYPYGVVKSSNSKLGINYTKGESTDRTLWNIKDGQIYPAPTPDEVNSPDFGVIVSYARNIGFNKGFVLIDYLRLFVEWTDPAYSLRVVPEFNNVLLNEELVYIITLKNINKIHQGKPVKVHINYDSNLSFVKFTDLQKGTYDDLKRIWYAKLDETGKSVLYLKFQAKKFGILECNAKTDFGIAKHLGNVNVVSPEFKIQTNYSCSKIEMIQNERINYSIIATTNTDLVDNKKIKIPLLPNIEIKNFRGDGEFDASTGIWNAEFKNKRAQLHLCINASLSGNFVQNIEIDGEIALTKEFIIMKEEESKDLDPILENISPSGMQLLKDGENIASESEFDKIDLNENIENSYYSNNENVAIKVENVTMKFSLNIEKIDNFKEYFIKFIKKELKQESFLALDNVSFTLDKGDRLGIVGLNGAGKSTLLKIVAEVMKPTEGSVHVNGRISPLLELGAGFDPNYTGKENIFLNGSILGYSKEFIEDRFDKIAEFSELGKFLDIPIKNYSSGMKSKLGFSIATIVEPDILILDEILSVGDVKFRKKSGDKIKSLFESGVTVLLVSHSTDQVRDLCNRAIWLEKGKIVMEGSADDVCDAYEESVK
ncbi:MAG: ABC transporter ATP-binding protein [Methanobacteriaceae archaeon]|jgi:ABC-type polysaccharide/polyol phosphate transport system ATPase subunit|nr:ABC transporter ATP-binding protein [Candidatus Methanorudis spinitermitis]